MSGTGKKSFEEECAALLATLNAQIDAAESANMTTSGKLLAEIEDLKAEIERVCLAGDLEKARRMAEIAVSIARTGEATKE